MKPFTLSIDALEVLDPRGNPTVHVTVQLGHAAVFGK